MLPTIDPQALMEFMTLVLFGVLAASALLATGGEAGRQVRDAVLDITSFVAIGATLGSLYLSEGAGLIPCELCWFQRIAMYPLAVILPVARWRRDRSVLPYVRLLAIVGFLIGAYHVQLQLFPEQSSFCEVSNPCSSTVAEAFGVFTIPQLSTLSFLLLVVHTSVALRDVERTPNVNHP